MQLWRISIYSDLSGSGGLLAAGRWHSRGRRIVYLADHPSTALLETLVHMDRDLLASTFRLLRVVVAESVTADRIDAATLPPDWRNQLDITQRIGDGWLHQSASVLLQVPSVIVPEAQNYLLNPVHADAVGIAVREIFQAPFDPRLFR